MKARGLFACLSAAVALWATQAFAEDVAAARALFEQGQALMAEAKYPEACAKFQASEQSSPRVNTLLNLAGCFEKTGQNASAYGAYTDAITLGRRQGKPEFEELAKEKANALEPTLLKLTIVVPPDAMVEGLQITRDKVALSEGAWGSPIPIDPGKHTIEASAPKKITWKTTIEITQDKKESELKVQKLEDAPVEAPKVVTKVVEVEGFWTGQRIAGTIIGSVGGLSLIGSAVFFGVASSTWNDAKRECGAGYPDNCVYGSNAPAKADQANTYATVSSVLAVGGLVAVAGGVVLFLLGAPKTSQEKAAIFPVVSPFGVGAQGRF